MCLSWISTPLHVAELRLAAHRLGKVDALQHFLRVQGSVGQLCSSLDRVTVLETELGVARDLVDELFFADLEDYAAAFLIIEDLRDTLLFCQHGLALGGPGFE